MHHDEPVIESLAGVQLSRRTMTGVVVGGTALIVAAESALTLALIRHFQGDGTAPDRAAEIWRKLDAFSDARPEESAIRLARAAVLAVRAELDNSDDKSRVTEEFLAEGDRRLRLITTEFDYGSARQRREFLTTAVMHDRLISAPDSQFVKARADAENAWLNGYFPARVGCWVAQVANAYFHIGDGARKELQRLDGDDQEQDTVDELKFMSNYAVMMGRSAYQRTFDLWTQVNETRLGVAGRCDVGTSTSQFRIDVSGMRETARTFEHPEIAGFVKSHSTASARCL